jgi:ubiquinone/menaquinone biosynthesis C-methylase UbiE
MQSLEVERLFSGPIGAEYAMLQLICPAAAAMSALVAEVVAGGSSNRPVSVFEIGCGTGVTSLCLLDACKTATITAVDNEAVMLAQARNNLAAWLEQGRMSLVEADALSALQALPSASVDWVASGYAVHNFFASYRHKVLAEIFRVLKPGGAFVNGDRYALDDSSEHTRQTQDEVRHWFKSFAAIGRYDLLEQWIVHLFSDESEDHIMRLGPSLAALEAAGFGSVEVRYRDGVNTLVVATKTVPVADETCP